MHQLVPGINLEYEPVHLVHPILRAMSDYVAAKRGGRPMASRRDLVPSEFKSCLGWVTIVEVLSHADDFRYRLVGSRIAEFFGADSTGRTVREAFAPAGPDAVAVMLALFRMAVERKAIVRTFGTLGVVGRDLQDFDSLYIPFSSDGATVDAVMNITTLDHTRATRAYSERMSA
jgi:hypothetical protein